MTEIREICKLSDQELEARRRDLGRGLASRIRDRRDLRDGMILSFDSTPELREELNAFVAFERECCPGLDFSLSDASGNAAGNADGIVELEIRGVDPHSDFFADLGAGVVLEVDAATEVSRRWRRLLSSIGLGTLGALSLCCVLPFATAALLGTAAVAPLTNLDDPWLISASALVFAGGIWFWQRRRDGVPRATSAGGCGC